MIHGFTLDHQSMLGCMEPLFRRKTGWKRIYIDLPGMGRSKAPSAVSSDRILGGLIEFCNSALEGESFALAAKSYGGYLARGLVNKLQERVKGLLLICPVILAESQRRTLPRFSVYERDARFMNSIDHWGKADFEAMAVIQTRKTWSRYERDIIPGLMAHDRLFCNELATKGYGLNFDPDVLAEPFQRPALILSGRQDHIVGYVDSLRLLDIYQKASLAVLDGAGHNLEIEKQVEFRTLVSAWLSQMALFPNL